MKTCSPLVTLSVLLALLGLTEARLGPSQPDERTTPEHQDASIDDEQERNLQQGERSFSNPNALADNDNYMRVMVGFKNENGRRIANGMGKKWMREMRNSRVATMLIPRVSLESLRSNPNIQFVEEDGMMTPDSESVPFGISMTKGDSSMIPVSRGSSSSSACSDPDSFKVAIIDSGVEADHPDIPCRDINDLDTNCKGISIGIGDLPWYAPTRRAGHGTHVFGTIGAIGGNDEGVAGMVPDSAGICYLIARVSDDDSNVVYASTVFEAIDWAITQGANVINLSLGGATFYQAGQNLIDKAHENGALTVATAGNSGSENLHYPGSFDHVLSVAAVDADGTRASFSQQNEKVDVAAPGVGIVSTYIGGGYVAATGTSMAAPHVTGAIAKVWSVCRQCSNAQVETCLLTTASGAPSRTNQLGFGIVNAEDTYECLVNTDGCCAETTQLRIQSIRQREPNLLVQKTQESEPVQEVEVARVAECTRRKPGEQCRRGAHCCSGECVGQWGARTCKAA